MVSSTVCRIQICIKLITVLLALAAGKPLQGKGHFGEVKIAAPKIILGTDVQRRNASHPHPYLVSIQYKDNNGDYHHSCGGAILDQWTIITAAHCFDHDYQPDCWGSDPDRSCYRVIAGMYDIFTRDPIEQISEFSSEAIDDHEAFDGFHYDNDIALIHLDTPLNYTQFVKPIRLVNPDRHYRTTNATIAGWGRSVTDVTLLRNNQHITQFLQETRVNIYTDEYCQHLWGDDYHPENMICASGGFSKGHVGHVSDACQGDSGGPLVAKDINRKRRYLIGLISWGYDCGIKEFPGLYTRVQTYLPWIEEKRAAKKSTRRETDAYDVKVPSKKKRTN